VKIFVCEFVTGGGLYREPLPASLAQEGGLMLEALLNDLAELPGIELLTTRDVRLPPLPLNSQVDVIGINPEQDVEQIWKTCLKQADAFWPIAPESGGILAQMSDLAIAHDKVLLSSAPSAVRLAASKLATNIKLAAAGTTVVPTSHAKEWKSAGEGPWVAKPDNGAGCEDSRVFHTSDAMLSWLAIGERWQSHVIQPLVAGTPASISMLCHNGEAVLLSCNRQLIEMIDDQFHYHGSLLNGMRDYWSEFEKIAQVVAKTIPGLAGYVGVDLLVGEKQISVLEINPRLTTSYAGLHRAIGSNPARLIVDLLYNGDFRPPPVIERNIVEVRLSE
jgi:predicted ATP-grasp superfamily ATP-dependent carboligase